MDKKLLEYISEKSQELINSSTCSNGAKSAAESWLKAVGTENEASETKNILLNWNLILCLLIV